MFNKITGIVAIAVLIGFMGILVGFVPEVDLGIVIAVVVIMAGYDFYRSIFRGRNGDR